MSELPKRTPDRILSFTDHLQEMRVRIIICLIFFVVAFASCFALAPRIVGLLVQPLTSIERQDKYTLLTLRLNENGTVQWGATAAGTSTDKMSTAPALLEVMAKNSMRFEVPGAAPILIGPKSRTTLSYLTPFEPFFLWMQGALLASAVFTIPMIVYQLWLFISPGLLGPERRVVRPLLFVSLFLFPLGAGFAYMISKLTLQVLLSFGDSIPGLEANLVASKYVSFILIMMVAFGLLFEFPLVLILLSSLGIVDSKFLIKKRKVAVLIIAIAAAFATPSPDPISMMALLMPLLALYEGSIWAIRLLERKAAQVKLQAT